MPTIVEGMLPVEFLIRHSIYMQTCTHIELASWEITQLAEGFDHRNQKQVELFLRLKQSNYNLADAFEKSAKLCDDAIGTLNLTLARRIKDGLDNRNSAAHGAWFFEPESGTLCVEHYWKEYSSKRWFHSSEPVSVDQVDFAIENAESILRELINIRKELSALKSHESRSGL